MRNVGQSGFDSNSVWHCRPVGLVIGLGFVKDTHHLNGVLPPAPAPVMHTVGHSSPVRWADSRSSLAPALFDDLLQREIGGYNDYAARMHCRLFPGVW